MFIFGSIKQWVVDFGLDSIHHSQHHLLPHGHLSFNPSGVHRQHQGAAEAAAKSRTQGHLEARARAGLRAAALIP